MTDLGDWQKDYVSISETETIAGEAGSVRRMGAREKVIFKALRLDEMVTKRMSIDGEKWSKDISRLKIKEESAQDTE